MPITIGIDDVLGRKAREARQREAAALAQSLLEKGAEPSTANQVAQTYAQTGKIDFPEYETKTLEPTNLFPEGIPTRKPFSLDKKKALYGFDASSGQFTDMSGQPASSIPDNVEPAVQRFKEPGPKNGRAYRLDTATGKTELIGPNGKESDTYEKWNSKTGVRSGGGTRSPEDQLALSQIKIYQRAIQNGDDITPETMAATRSASEHFGINLDQVDEDPSLLDRIFDREPEQSQPILQYKGTKQGKTLSTDEAAKFGDLARQQLGPALSKDVGRVRQKARELARKAGHTF